MIEVDGSRQNPINAPPLPSFVQITNSSLNFTEIGYPETQALISVQNRGEPISVESPPLRVESGGILYSPTNRTPGTGEYFYDPIAGTIQVAPSVRSLIITTRQQQDTIPVVGMVLPPHPEILLKLPIEGEISIGKTFEGMPGGSFQFTTKLHKSRIIQILAPGTEFLFYGLPLRINNLNIKEYSRSTYPEGICEVSISLGCRWENYLEAPVFLRGDGATTTPQNTPFVDSECGTGSANGGVLEAATTIQALFARATIPLIGEPLSPVSLANIPRDAVADISSLLGERLRPKGSFVRYSNPSGVEVVRLGAVRVWEYDESQILEDIDINYEAIARTNKRQLQCPDINESSTELLQVPRSEPTIPLGFEYPNTELSGKFTQSNDSQGESSQGQNIPRWVRRPQTRETRVDGDINAHLPLEGVTSVSNLSLCFDIGGQTKTRTTSEIEDGAEIRVTTEIWGFAFTAISIYDASTRKLRGNPYECWRCIKRTTKEFIYDLATGYLVAEIESGFMLGRFKKESAEKPETLIMQANNPSFSAYRFIEIPVVNRTTRRLKKIDRRNADADFFETYKICNRDGTSTVGAVVDPNYAPPYYVEAERTESSSFATIPNPENQGLTQTSSRKALPDLFTGEESIFESLINIIPAKYEYVFSSDGSGQDRELIPQRWTKININFKAQGAGMADSQTEVTYEHGTGDPPLALRRPAVYEKAQIAQIRGNGATSTAQPPAQQQKYRHLIQTAGYAPTDPIGGSESFSEARTLEEALTAARTKAAIENWRAGYQENLTIAYNPEIKEGDRFNYWCNGEYRQRVVMSITNNLKIYGVMEDGQRLVTGITKLTLGRYVLPEITHTAIPLPDEATASNNSNAAVAIVTVASRELGGVFPWNTLRSRRRPE